MLTLLRAAHARILAFFNARTLDHDFEQELESHLAMLDEDNVRRGMNPEQARRHAAIRLGGTESIKELHREARGLPALEILLQDLRYTFRTLRRDTAFSVFAVLIVGLGIGVCSSMFCVVNALLLHLPFPDSSRLVWIWNRGGRDVAPARMMPVGHFVGLRDHTRTLSDLSGYYGAYRAGDISLAGIGEPLRLTGVPVTQNFFSVLGVQPQMGRTFNEDECNTKWGSQQAVIFSYGLWASHFGSDPAIIGRQFTLTDSEFTAFHPGATVVTVVGVMPPTFNFATVFDPDSRVDLYLPLPLTEEVTRQGNTMVTFGRLKPGTTIQRAQTELSILSAQIRRKDPSEIFSPASEPSRNKSAGVCALLLLYWPAR